MRGPCRLAILLAALIVAALACAPAAFAGRLIATGHDIDFHCAVNTPPGGECHFVNVAVGYVRATAPDPTKPVLVLDRGSLRFPAAINAAFGTGVVPMTVVDPQSAAFATLAIDTAHFSAILVASDISCGGCDLNGFPSGTTPSTPDSTAIFGRVSAIASFFDAGGGILAAAGASDSFGLAFSDTNVNYYAFVDVPGAANATGPFALTALGRAIGITDGTLSTPDDLLNIGCPTGCTHNSFSFPPAGSRLKAAEIDTSGTGRFVTLVEDTDPPSTTIISGPPATTTSRTATFAFGSSEDHTSFQCQLDGAAFADCSSAPTFAALGEGRHTLQVRSVDLVGNVEQTPKAYSWTVVPASTAPPAADTTPPTGKLSGKKTQKLGKHVSVTVTCVDEACTATAGGSVKPPKSAKSYKLTSVSTSLTKGGHGTLVLKLSAKARKAIKKALAAHRKVSAKLTVVLADGAGNRATLKRTVKLKL